MTSAAEAVARDLRLAELVMRLRAGRAVTDASFDEIYPGNIRRLSATFWTPVAVACRAATLLAPDRASRVLDVGAGAGKLCILGSIATGATFVGVEQRAHLVEIAVRAASRASARGASFVHGHFDALDVTAFTGIYFFNPFEENLWPPKERIDEAPGPCAAKFDEDVRRAHAMLQRTRAGTRVVAYHGLGALMPHGFVHVLRERQHTGYLDLWIRCS